jgi:predicted nucleic acid-binding protein
MRLVLDASAAVRVVLGGEGAQAFAKELATCALVVAPTLFQSEVANTMWKYVQAGQLDAASATSRLQDALDLVDEFAPDADYLPEALLAATRHQHPVYDMLYLVVARQHACDLMTADRKLAQLWRQFAQ